MQNMTPAQRVQVIAALSGADVRTVRRFVDGGQIRKAAVRERLEIAARQVEQIQAMPEKQTPAT
jgi:hypothetical protein